MAGPEARSQRLLSFLLSIPTLVTGVVLHLRTSSHYISYLDVPLIVVGVLLAWFSLGPFLNPRDDKPLHVCATNFFIVVLLAVLFGYTVFAFVVSCTETVSVTTGSGYKEYTLREGNSWLQRWVKDSGKWLKIKRSLQHNNVCDGIVVNMDSSGRYIYQDPSPIQSGCCKPPYECDFVYRNATTWEAPESVPPHSSSTDCTTWSNDQSELCYDCRSCKAGVITIVRKDWKTMAIINIIFLPFLITVNACGCLVCLVYARRRMLAAREQLLPDAEDLA